MKNILAISCFFGFFSVVNAQSVDENALCDCSVVTGQCRAQVVKEDDAIVVRSNHQMCSRVTWFADENPFTTIVRDGRAVEEWLGPFSDPFLSVADCEVCMASSSTLAEAPPEPAEPPPSGNSQPIPIIQLACPRALDEVSGSATFSFSVTESGEVTDIELIDTTEELIVDKATSTIARWRYEPAIVDGVPVETTIEATVDCENLPPRRPE